MKKLQIACVKIILLIFLASCSMIILNNSVNAFENNSNAGITFTDPIASSTTTNSKSDIKSDSREKKSLPKTSETKNQFLSFIGLLIILVILFFAIRHNYKNDNSNEYK
ncbi:MULTISPECIES: LPXTG cell wall anchor domain-containing protein [unclassified Enterococcus]|uniref:LPXTG cell wall anchor domain-containing protein n=1 Tax=unclassified Enterococcus TaxID=2608891 RepID=UPI001553C24F|nr:MULTISPECIES: LPXTG cell wall anchor domain-containing protein [unclassified Enterococcus]MBS7577962.1 LPXTG cell wall anchor domain-containing protein [Enterococcus sp. MMGLQ5-2]MBS7585177.1 LPXTG cell wall anchor domain-containing protein [Enterococcus sp. MMGLQ5-1]NPD13034.1 LPXTG cell wall anchor domain-containing protein [Enterococcus sp. MMGLQ5-1]NPD37792.1 LPXTG cell wall anchor domain-containing protein [Enterococcus sp. MMGLQ5-2]